MIEVMMEEQPLGGERAARAVQLLEQQTTDAQMLEDKRVL